MTVNPALADLEFLAGVWDMELSDASFLPDPATGDVGFDAKSCRTRFGVSR